LRAALCDEAIRLGQILAALTPNEGEVLGLLALMLLHDSRRLARMDGAGNLITLDNQARDQWDQARIAGGRHMLRQALALNSPGPYQIQAAISALHAAGASHETTDWHEITRLYGQLYALQPSPVIALNGAVALSFADSPTAGLAALAGLNDDGALARYQPYHAARADLLRRAGQFDDAATAYGQALKYTTNEAERRFLQGRLDSL
jgi:RNA polymerase sigma-70 factor (ECF subfamily)